ncbi:MAG: hypothetical protein AMXMBFR61_27380 [Fimbriimonadales bacterium]
MQEVWWVGVCRTGGVTGRGVAGSGMKGSGVVGRGVIGSSPRFPSRAESGFAVPSRTRVIQQAKDAGHQPEEASPRQVCRDTTRDNTGLPNRRVTRDD